jgi:sec-independent protein translocase protein TatC
MNAPVDESELEGTRAPFLEHLVELRKRLWYSVLSILVCALVCYNFHNELFFFLTAPLYEIMAARNLGDHVSFRSMGGVFAFHMQTAFLGGLFFGLPIVLWQLWQFIGPGLYKKERVVVLPFVAASLVCFVGGAAFCYYLVLPDAFDFLLDYSINEGPKKLLPDINIEEYLNFVVKFMLGFGVAFELPTVMAFLASIGVVTHRGLLKFWRYATVIIFVVAAVLTPPDVFSQLLMAIPLIGLYFISVGVSFFITKRREARLPPPPPPDPEYER